MSGNTAAQVEYIEAEAWAHLLLALPPLTRAALRTEVHRSGTAVRLRAPGADVAAMNVAFGLGIDRELTTNDLESINKWFIDAGVRRWIVEWSPEARPADGERLLIESGGARKTPTVKLYRELSAAGAAEVSATQLEIREIGPDDASLFVATVAEPLGVPEETVAGIRRTIGDPAWHFYLAFEGGEAIAGGALFVFGDGAWFGLAGTAPHARRHGAQTALLRRRLRDAHRLGCTWASGDTQPEIERRPNASLGNMLRVGFKVLYERPKYLFEARAL